MKHLLFILQGQFVTSDVIFQACIEMSLLWTEVLTDSLNRRWRME